MSIFAESSWAADAVGDKLSNQMFHKKKTGKKHGMRNKPGLILSPAKTHKHGKPDDNIEPSAKKRKLKSKKRSKAHSIEENEHESNSKNVKSQKNGQPAKHNTVSTKSGKLNAKKRKRSISTSVAPEGSNCKKSKITSGQNMISRDSESPKQTKKEKNLKKISNGPNNKMSFSKKDKVRMNKEAKKNSGQKGKSMESASTAGQSSSSNQETKSQKKRKKKKLKKVAIAEGKQTYCSGLKSVGNAVATKNLDLQRLEKMLVLKEKKVDVRSKIEKEPESLRDRMMSQLRASRFRFLNETLYNNVSSESKKYFNEDPDAFAAYHSGYRQQVEQWPLNPLDIIITSIKKMSTDYIVADFGCGEARLAESVTQKVHSLDLVAVNEKVKACDMAHTSLLTNGVNVVVFCLSLMGTNLADYLLEANRVLKKDGILKIADVESRFENVDEFISLLGNYGFVNTWKDLSHNLFYFMDFKKITEVNRRTKNLPKIALKPCLYKKR